MQYEILKNPVGMVEFRMDKGDSVTGEAGAMVYTMGNVETNTKLRRGGLFKTIKTAALGGESFFINEFTAKEDGCRVGLTGSAIGDIEKIQVDNELIIQSGAYVGHIGDLTLDTKWQGFTRGIFGSNLFMLKTIGNGEIFIDALGGILKQELAEGEMMTLDNYHLVAMDSSMHYDIGKHGSLKTTILGGEALVIKIRGPGSVWYQTKNLQEFAATLEPFFSKR